MKSELPVRGDKMLAKKADASYAKVLTQDTIGLNVDLRQTIDPRRLFVSGSDLVINSL